MKLFAWGANTHGQLCLGFKSDKEDIPTPVNLKPFPFFAHEISEIRGGGGTTLILLANGTIAGIGINVSGQVGNIGTDHVATLSPAQKKFFFKNIDTKWDFVIGLTWDGKVYAWGSNNYGQFGVAKSCVVSSKIPIEIPISRKAVDVACGIRHALILTDDGLVLSGGCNRKGQLGRNMSNHDSWDYLPVSIPRTRAIACGQNHCLVVTMDNKVFCWGSNRFGQVGAPLSRLIVEKPFCVRIKDVELDDGTKPHCGWTHSALLTGDGKVVNWGRNSYFQLGRQTDSDIVWEPALLGLSDVNQLSLGSEHNLAITDDGAMWAWGWNEHSSCAIDDPQSVELPTKIHVDWEKTCRVFACTGQSFAVVK